MKFEMTAGVNVHGKPMYKGEVVEFDKLPDFLVGKAIQMVEEKAAKEPAIKPAKKTTKKA
jgi:hypothetical protein